MIFIYPLWPRRQLNSYECHSGKKHQAGELHFIVSFLCHIKSACKLKKCHTVFYHLIFICSHFVNTSCLGMFTLLHLKHSRYLCMIVWKFLWLLVVINLQRWWSKIGTSFSFYNSDFSLAEPHFGKPSFSLSPWITK